MMKPLPDWRQTAKNEPVWKYSKNILGVNFNLRYTCDENTQEHVGKAGNNKLKDLWVLTLMS